MYEKRIMFAGRAFLRLRIARRELMPSKSGDIAAIRNSESL